MDQETVKFSISLPDEDIELVVPKLRLMPRRYEFEDASKPFPGTHDPLGWPIKPSDLGLGFDDSQPNL